MDPGLRRIVVSRLEADGALEERWGPLVLAALEGRERLEAQLKGGSASVRRGASLAARFASTWPGRRMPGIVVDTAG